MNTPTPSIFVSSEVGRLRRLMIHSPDSGLGKVVPSKAQDWLFEDIVHLDTMRRKEYDYYLKLLLYFLDPDKVKGKLASIDADKSRSFFKPDNPNFHASDKVLEVEYLLSQVLADPMIRIKLVASICALEHEWYTTQNELLALSDTQLAQTLISGTTPTGEMLFPPIPNLIFTRDIGITINNHVLLNRPAKQARTREALLAQYIYYNHPVFEETRNNLIEIPDNDLYFLLPENEKDYTRTTLEGGDVMMVAPNHLLIGVSERTSAEAVKLVTKILFDRNVVQKVTAVKIPIKRDYMHIDTVFTQVKRNVWVVLKSLAKTSITASFDRGFKDLSSNKSDNGMKILQFRKEEHEPVEYDNLEHLLKDISINDLGCKAGTVQFIYSGGGIFPYGDREQWTDSCNLLALKEGVVVGYDRNDYTLEAFRKEGFRTIRIADLLEEFEQGISSPDTLTDTFVMLPSAELSRARGGSHCMSMPLLRDRL
jgi:arginine deiminase